MSQLDNPFIRGYRSLHIARQLLITHADDYPPVWRSLHPVQAHLSEEQINQFPCVFDGYFAVITEGQQVPQSLEDQCRSMGIVRSVVYAISGQDFDGKPVHLGDFYLEEAARKVMSRLSFETGVYGRVWEISTAHITKASSCYLSELADIATPSGLLFEVFRFPYGSTLGVKLIATPWTDENLMHVDGITAEQLRWEYLSQGIPDDLVQILHLAGQADVRILIFDADAPELPDLPLMEV
ncbi:ABC transporter substrate-binding protein [Pseudomonas abyssi]|uniref:ABC transporter substrate-binding protein n=1 Tax=Pseudomonas abyssi TaxID=170540 RepID=A0A2A3MGI6_9PSED|nr:ABC transporter substrate-binding protein [Pseudomonas abyssi]PBK03674.1 ABC transporter substrate-binding protein [Pseudomonas abyssi]